MTTARVGSARRSQRTGFGKLCFTPSQPRLSRLFAVEGLCLPVNNLTLALHQNLRGVTLGSVLAPT